VRVLASVVDLVATDHDPVAEEPAVRRAVEAAASALVGLAEDDPERTSDALDALVDVVDLLPGGEDTTVFERWRQQVRTLMPALDTAHDMVGRLEVMMAEFTRLAAVWGPLTPPPAPSTAAAGHPPHPIPSASGAGVTPLPPPATGPRRRPVAPFPSASPTTPLPDGGARPRPRHDAVHDPGGASGDDLPAGATTRTAPAGRPVSPPAGGPSTPPEGQDGLPPVAPDHPGPASPDAAG
jgi:hypothetical protein